MTATFFTKPSDFRKWLQKNYKSRKELLVGFYKVGSKKPSITWPQSVDEALCFGWIDGVRKSIDKDRYSIRFTPRKAGSIWSAVNIKKAESLAAKGLMKPAGLELFKNRNPAKTNLYSFESEAKFFSGGLEKKFKKNKAAWEFFTKQAPSYKRTVTHWVMTANKEATRHNRLEKLITGSEKQKRIF